MCEVAEFCGYCSGQLIVAQVQEGEVGEVAELGGYCSGQSVVAQV